MTLTQVTVPSENKLGSLPGYVSSGDHKAAIIVLQEWWGVNEQIKVVAERWYSDKYIVMVPDLYRGKVASDHETAGHYFKDLNWEGAIQDIQGAVNYLRSQRGVTKVGITGFCMGGALSLSSSILADGLDAAAPFYGVADLGDPAQAKVPLQLHFGTNDQCLNFSDPPTQDKLEKTLKEANRVFEFYRYEGANHGFVNETRKENYNKECADLAHKRTLDFFGKYLN